MHTTLIYASFVLSAYIIDLCGFRFFWDTLYIDKLYCQSLELFLHLYTCSSCHVVYPLVFTPDVQLYMVQPFKAVTPFKRRFFYKVLYDSTSSIRQRSLFSNNAKYAGGPSEEINLF